MLHGLHIVHANLTAINGNISFQMLGYLKYIYKIMQEPEISYRDAIFISCAFVELFWPCIPAFLIKWLHTE